MGRITTHVLDTAHGQPAAGVRVTLTRVVDGAILADVATDADGRSPRPLLEGDTMAKGAYELAFHAGDFFRGLGVVLADPLFFDVIPVRFAVADEDGHYHVPLLLSPYGYSTYRGS